VIIEGAKLTVCTECSKHGKATWEPTKPTPTPQRGLIGASQGPQMKGPIQIRKRVITARVDNSLELVEDYADEIRVTREKLGLSTEDLGKKINEKESVLKKIELGKMAPTELLISKLEHALKIKLLIPVPEEKVPFSKTSSPEFTLGDAIKIDKKEKGE
jgi:putative transcription factor